MSSSRHERAKGVFLGACNQAGEERDLFVARACASDPDLLSEVESLLAFHDAISTSSASAEATSETDWGTDPLGLFLCPGQTVSHYRISRRLGGGGMGEVFEAEDLRLGRKVALKFLHSWIADDETLRSRFDREARAASSLDHPAICTIHDIDTSSDGRLFIVMAYYEGQTLRERLQGGALRVAEALRIACEVARGLARAHDGGIVHRDVKPANIFLTTDSRVKILDFGLAKLAGGEDLSRTGLAMGTTSFMSPEQALGRAVDHRTDVWSLGVVLYESLTGTRPFRGDQPQAVIRAILEDRPEPVTALRPGLSLALERIAERALAKDPDKRFPRMVDLLAELEAAADRRRAGGAEQAAPPREEPEIAVPKADSSAFVGRESELAKLAALLDSAVGGKGLVAFVCGEAGSGKTALITHFARRARRTHPDLLVTGGNCNAHTGIGDPYLPFCEALALLTGDIEAGWAAKTLNRREARRLWRLLPETVDALLVGGRGLIETFVAGPPLVTRATARAGEGAEWLEELSRVVEAKTTGGDAAPPPQSDLFEQYTRVLMALARKRPVLLLLDNMQWADAGSVSLLFHLGQRIGSARIFVVGAFRSSEIALGRGGERHPLESVINEFKLGFGVDEIDLDRAEGRGFVDSFLDIEPNRLSREFRDQLYRQTRGHALYTIELVREMEDRGVLLKNGRGFWTEGPALDWTAIPPRVEAVVGERIARLPEESRELLTLASVEGESFTAEVLASVLDAKPLEVVRHLGAELHKRQRLVWPLGTRRINGQPISLYRFRHFLFRQYVYQSLTEPERTYLHERVGGVLEALYDDAAGEISTQLAWHFEEAGVADRAAFYLRQAGEKAARQSAHQEAIGHFEKGLELVETLAEGPERARLELGLLIGLGPVLMGVKGWAAPETERTYHRARELCEVLGEARPLFPVCWGLWQATILRTELGAAREMAAELLDLAESLEDPTLLPVAYRAMAESAFWLADFEAARDLAEMGFSLYDPEAHRSLGFVYGTDPGAFCLAFGGWSLWYLGFPDQAVARIEQMVELARATGHQFTLGMALDFVAIGRQERGELEETRQASESIMSLASEQGFELLQVLGQLHHGWAMAELGHLDEGIAELRDGFASYPAPLARSWFLSMLAEELARAGDHDGVLETVAQGLAESERNGNRVWDADLHRIRAESLAARGAPAAEVEAGLRRAIEVAREQGARSLELRVATRLSRHLAGQGRESEARELLSEAYDLFTEGFATRDLREARELLGTLER